VANLALVTGKTPRLAPLSDLIRRVLASVDLGDAELLPSNWPPLLDLTGWMRSSRREHQRVVVGRHARDHRDKWPDDPETIAQAYCADDPDIDVRILGGADFAIEHLAGKPANWTIHPFNSMDVKGFLHDLDVYVYFPHPQIIEAFGRAPLEAMAAGVPAIVPPAFRELYGDGAIYVEPKGVREAVRNLVGDVNFYEERVRRGADFVRATSSAESFAARVAPFLSRTRLRGADPTSDPARL
jgi:glycosyltransferase involved in cell wall biosynthesis